MLGKVKLFIIIGHIYLLGYEILHWMKHLKFLLAFFKIISSMFPSSLKSFTKAFAVGANFPSEEEKVISLFNKTDAQIQEKGDFLTVKINFVGNPTKHSSRSESCQCPTVALFPQSSFLSEWKEINWPRPQFLRRETFSRPIAWNYTADRARFPNA